MSYLATVESSLPSDWQRAMRVVVDGIRAGVRDACAEGAEEARRVHKYKDRTGALTASIVSDSHDVPLGAEGEIVAGEKYASFVEGGTRPHDIRPRSAQALRWEDADGVHFARVVHHPGTPPLPFMGPAHQKAERLLVARIEGSVGDAQAVFDK